MSIPAILVLCVAVWWAAYINCMVDQMNGYPSRGILGVWLSVAALAIAATLWWVR